MGWAGHLRIGYGVDHHQRQVDLLLRKRPAGVEPGQQQQVVNQRGHPGGFRFHPAQRVRDALGVVLLAPGKFRVTADRRQWGAQFMRGIRYELPHPHLGRLPGNQGAGDMAQHLVQGGTDLADLGAGVGVALGYPDTEVNLTCDSGSALTWRAVWTTRSSGRSDRRTIQ